MTNQPKFRTICASLIAVAGFAASTVSSQAVGVVNASATISSTAVSGGFDYTIALLNTGNVGIESFWYGWTQLGNNLAVDPTTAGNSLGWANTLDANSIMWVGGSATQLAAGSTATFTFFSTSTPSAITTAPSGESVVYAGGIDFSQGTAGDSSGAFSPVLVASPEPSSIALLAFGSLGLLAGGWRKLRAQS